MCAVVLYSMQCIFHLSLSIQNTTAVTLESQAIISHGSIISYFVTMFQTISYISTGLSSSEFILRKPSNIFLAQDRVQSLFRTISTCLPIPTDDMQLYTLFFDHSCHHNWSNIVQNPIYEQYTNNCPLVIKLHRTVYEKSFFHKKTKTNKISYWNIYILIYTSKGCIFK